MEHLQVHPETPQDRIITAAADTMLRGEGIGIYPTDTVYGVGCTVSNHKKIKEIAKILHKDRERKFSFLLPSISQANEYAEISTANFKILKRCTPGPFTFILPASHFVKKRISKKRKYIGLRIPDNTVLQRLLHEVKAPLANISLNTPGENRGDPERFMTPEVLNGVDFLLDAGTLPEAGPSTIIDLTGTEPALLRQGKGVWHEQ
ncbi:MAG: L-threonylcarbamoyladenylate synthase [Fibrobacterota bacterium]